MDDKDLLDELVDEDRKLVEDAIAIYPGLAILNTSTSSYVLAPNFGLANAVEVYDNTFKPTKLAGSFTDPNLPMNYAPYSIHVLGSQVFVCYALR